MSLGKYILDDKNNPVEVHEVLIWGEWFQQNPERRRVAQTVLPDGKLVSTVFLGLDHNFGYGAPLIFETMVFSADRDTAGYRELDMDRYSTWKQAEKGHAAMVKKWQS